MPPTCNINSKGKALRLAMGCIVAAVGLLLVLVWAYPAGTRWPWIVSLIIIAFGGFQIFEGWAGWCAVRAMGFKTRI